MKTCIIIGAGGRGKDSYAPLIHKSGKMKIIGVAEPDEHKHTEFCAAYGIEPDMSFCDYKDMFAKGRLADAVLICTQDRKHYEPAMLAMKRGYHILLEKPISPIEDEIKRLEKAAAEYDRIFITGFVLRYTPFIQKIKSLCDSGAIGRIMTMQLNENEGYRHHAHSYVRGQWNNDKTSSPLILAKSCHDMDLMLYLINKDNTVENFVVHHDGTKHCGGSGHNPPRNKRYSTFFSPTVFSAALDEFVADSGVKLRFDTLTTYPAMDGNICEGVITESVSGTEFFGAKVVIDATGDASVIHRAEIPTVEGKNYMTYVAHYCDLTGAERLCGDADFSAFRKWMGIGSDMFGNGHPEDMKRISGTNTDDITEYMLTGKACLLKKIKSMDKDSFDIMTLPFMPQLRTIRRLQGAADFNAVDGETYDDAIGSCGDFRPDGSGKHYQIPFGALYNKDFPNILAAGRVISAPQGDGWEVARVIPNCALTGEASGKAAALYALSGYSFDGIRSEHMDKIFV